MEQSIILSYEIRYLCPFSRPAVIFSINNVKEFINFILETPSTLKYCLTTRTGVRVHSSVLFYIQKFQYEKNMRNVLNAVVRIIERPGFEIGSK